MSPWLIKTLVLSAALLSTSRACGPNFPATLIDNENALLAAPYAPFADSLRRIPLTPAEFPYVAPAIDQSLEQATLAAERLDLLAAGVPPETLALYQAARARHEPLPSAAYAVPDEFILHHDAACALSAGQLATATDTWQRLLDLPPAQRKYKSVWAAYMLGRLAGDTSTTRARFQQTRQFVRDGFADSLGLAAASLGWEAKTWLDQGNLATAADLYLQQHASGDPSALHSLRLVATRVLAGDNATLNAFAADARHREIITALVLAQREEEMFPQFVDDVPNLRTGATTRWLAALERAQVSDAAGAPRLALAAYRAGQYPLTARWLDLAPPDDDLALWLRAKLALREGDLDRATAHLSTLVRRTARPASSLTTIWFYRKDQHPPASGPVQIRAELGTLKLARRDYTEALDLLQQSQYSEDAAYVAEQVLTIDELQAYLAARPHSARAEPLRHLLARRLVRLGRLDEAQALMPAPYASSLHRFQTLLRTGQDSALASDVRATALMEAARLLRAEGMELRGTELAPDFSIWSGAFSGGLGLESRTQLPAYLQPSADEQARVTQAGFTTSPRFHYRYTAADLAWAAIALMPDNDDATARALIEAGGWLKARDPQAANRFYLALARRCRSTTLGQAARQQRWFPH